MNVSKRIVSLVLAIFLCAGVFPVIGQASDRQIKIGLAFVEASSLRLRSAASTGSKTLDYAYADEVVVLLEKSGDWYKVNYNLQTGYMHSRYLDTAAKENAELGYGTVNGNKVNVRTGPGTGYSSAAQAAKGDQAYIIGINNQWFKVIFGNVVGYIRSDYVDLTQIPYENRDSGNTPLFYKGGKSTGITPSAAALKGTAAATGSAVVATARKYIGVPYVWGGTSPSGFDCSGFTQYVLKAHGVTIPRTTKQQYTVGKSVSKSDLKPGDLVFFQNTYTTGISHVGFYVGDGKFIHSSSSKGITITALSNSYWSGRYYGARRVI